jgi:hypothetical protein
MNLRDAQVVLRPRSLSDLVDLGFRVNAAHATANLRLAVWLLLPPFIVCALLHHATRSWWLVWPLAVALCGIAQGAFTVALGQRLFTSEASAGAVLKRFARRVPSYLWTVIATRVLLLLSALLFVVMPVVWARLLFVHEAALLEQAAAGEAIRRSNQLGQGHRGALLGFWIILTVVPFAGVILAETLGQAAVENVLQWGAPFGRLWNDGGSLYALAGLFASVPLAATLRFLQYIDLRTRDEGWDIQLRFAALREGTLGEDRAPAA